MAQRLWPKRGIRLAHDLVVQALHFAILVAERRPVWVVPRSFIRRSISSAVGCRRRPATVGH
jgi:hypothetical protein